MKRNASIVAILVLAAAAIWWVFGHGGDPGRGVFLGYVEGDIVYIGSD